MVLANLKIARRYAGLIYLAEAARNLPLIRSHRHPELELNLVLQGVITYVIAGQRHTFPRGSLLWLFPAQEHQMIDRTTDLRCYVAVFKRSLIKRTCHDAAYAALSRDKAPENSGPGRQIQPLHFEALRRLMDGLLEASLDPDTLNREAGYGFQSSFHYEHRDPDALNAGLGTLLVMSWRYFQAGQPLTTTVHLHPGVQRALRLLGTADFEESLGSLAPRCGMSSGHLSRMFHRQVGVPLTQYRNSTRLSRFLDLYTRPRHGTMLDTVLAAGFGSYAQFYKVFVRTYGVGPGRYFGEAGGIHRPAVEPEADASRRAFGSFDKIR